MIGSLFEEIDYRPSYPDRFAKSIRVGLFFCLIFSLPAALGYAADPVTTGGIGNQDPFITGAVVPPTSDEYSGCTEVLLEGDQSQAEICPYDENGEVDYDRCTVAFIPCTLVAICPTDQGEQTQAQQTGFYYPGKEGEEDYFLTTDQEGVSEEFGAGGLNPLCFAVQTSGAAAAAAAAAGVVIVVTPPTQSTSP